ncbi:MAG: radical SAM protein [Candidatus Pacearchaeota archaeon]|nr:radical SAM protein [Candidatus Pacearchaeota archaeon]
MDKNIKINLKEINNRKTKLESYPIKLYLETTQKCNLKCIMCDQHIFSSEGKEFPIELFNKIKPLIKQAEEVNFFYVGEPLLSKNLKKFLIDTKNYAFLPKIFTNGTILNEEILNLFDERGVFVNISLESATKNIYEMIRNGASFEIFMNNLKKYAEKYKNRKNDQFHIRLSCTIAVDNLPEILNIIELAKKLGIRDLFFSAIDLYVKSNRYLVCDEKKTAFYFKEGKKLADKYKIRFSCPSKIGDAIIEENNNWNDFQLPIDKYVPKYLEAFNPNPLTNDCGYPWIQAIIRANGDICSCCQGRHIMGNLYKNTFEEIWNGKRYQELRAQKNFRYCLGRKCNMLCYSIWASQIKRK